MEGKEVIPRDEMVLKIRAAVATRARPVDARHRPHRRPAAARPRRGHRPLQRLRGGGRRPRVRRRARARASSSSEIARRVDAPSVANMSETGPHPGADRGRAAGARLPHRDLPVDADVGLRPRLRGALPRAARARARRPGSPTASCRSTRSTSSSASRSSSGSTSTRAAQPPQMPAVSPPSTDERRPRHPARLVGGEVDEAVGDVERRPRGARADAARPRTARDASGSGWSAK